jgi:flagellar biogenesis protein FliO
VKRVIQKALAVTAMTAAVTAMTATVAHAEDAPIGPPEGGTPLEVRPSRPLETAAPEPASSAWTKIGLCGLIVAGAVAFYMKKRVPGAVTAAPSIKVAARTSIGVRSEIILVDVDGHRLLLGVTPSSVRTLSVLPAEPSLAAETPEEPRIGADPISIGSSFEKLLARARDEEPIPALVLPATPKRVQRDRVPSDRLQRDEESQPYEGQVAVLRTLRSKSKTKG